MAFPLRPANASADAAVALLAAARLVAAVIGGRTLDEALAAARLAGVTRAAAQDLAYGALRQYGRGDFFLARLIERPLPDAAVRGLLLAALYRLEARPAEAHTTVNEAVGVAGRLARGKFRGLVNAVLRNFLRRHDELNAAAETDEVAHFCHPAWWIACLKRDHPAHWQAALAAGNMHPPLTLRVNRRRTTSAGLLAELAAAGSGARALDDAAILLDRPLPVERLPGFAAGRVSVQDWGAQRAAPLLAVRPGLRVLDACAAPGGKTAHLLELADVELTALEVDEKRAARIHENLARLGLAATVRVADVRDPAAWWDGRPFTRILADVPCSASGVARRRPDIKWLRRASDVAQFARAQAEILDALWRVLAPGGRMLYCTCSVFREENGAQVEAFVARHADARRLPTDGSGNELQLLPSAEHDGFYYALLQKMA